MRPGETEPGDAASLRRQAEEALRAQPARSDGALSHDEALALVHELQVHQIELELQNEELLRTRREAEALRDRYADLYDFAPAGYFTLDGAGAIREANLAGAVQLGVDRESLVGAGFAIFLDPDSRPGFAAFCADLLAGGATETCDVSFAARPGRGAWHAQLRGRADAAGAAGFLRLAVTDITDRRRAEDALRESEAKYRRFFDDDITGDFVSTPDGRILDCNPAFARMFGFPSVDDARSSGIAETYIVPGEREAVLDRLRTEGRLERDERFRRRRDGTWIHVVENLVGEFDDTGNLVEIRGYVSDDTQRYLADEALRESEEKFRLVADFTADWESWIGPDGSCIYVSPSCEQISGRSAEEFCRDPELFATLVHPDDRAAYEEHLKVHFTREAGHESIDLRIVTAGGTIRWISHHCRPVYGRDGSWLGRRISNRDITRRKLAEEALRRSEASMAHAQSTAHLGNWAWDLATNVLSCSDEHCRIYGLSPGNYPIEAFVDLVHEDDRQSVRDALAASLDKGAPYDVECRVVRPDGVERILHGEGEAVRDSAGSVTGMFGIAQDITERKLAEDALRETRDFLDSLIDYANAPIVVWDPAFRITRFNAAFEHLSGYAADEVMGRDLAVLFPEESREESMEKIQRTVTEHWESVEIPIRRPDGGVRIALWNSANIYDPSGTTLLATIAQGQDITGRKEAELRVARYTDELARSNEELQRFAYVASHDLQEPLRSIVSFSQLLERRYRGRLDSEADEYIDFIVAGGIRMQTLIQDLLQVSRIETGARPPAPTDANAVVNGALRALETPIREAGASVTVEALPGVMADRSQLEQVFVNLVGNAIKYRHPDRPPAIRIRGWRVGPMVEFAVQDNGIGIEAEYFDRIFVIFQRLHTREEYEGTGIGLAVVRKIVERHGGTVRVESVPGEGSTFFFTLPAA